MGPSHNYYIGRSGADITNWTAYFIEGMAISFEKVRDQALREAERGGKDQSRLLRNLDAKQRRALTLFRRSREIAAKDIAGLFGYKAAHCGAVVPALGRERLSGNNRSCEQIAPLQAGRRICSHRR